MSKSHLQRIERLAALYQCAASIVENKVDYPAENRKRLQGELDICIRLRESIDRELTLILAARPDLNRACIVPVKPFARHAMNVGPASTMATTKGRRRVRDFWFLPSLERGIDALGVVAAELRLTGGNQRLRAELIAAIAALKDAGHSIKPKDVIEKAAVNKQAGRAELRRMQEDGLYDGHAKKRPARYAR